MRSFRTPVASSAVLLLFALPHSANSFTNPAPSTRVVSSTSTHLHTTPNKNKQKEATFTSRGVGVAPVSQSSPSTTLLFSTLKENKLEREDVVASSTAPHDIHPADADAQSHEKIPAVDVIQDLDGLPLPNSYFEEKMGIDNVEHYTCPQKDAFSGFMSHACRVYLFPGKQSAFYKSIVFENLSHAREKKRSSPYKLIRDAKSYTVVASFLNSKACAQVRERAGVHIPEQYDAQLRPDEDDPMKSKFSFLHEDFAPSDGWYQQWLLHDEAECRAALSTFAKMHAFFWDGSTFWEDGEAGAELEGAIWKSGSYVQPRAQILDGRCSCTKVAEEWTTKRTKFEEELSHFDYWDDLGERLESISKRNGKLAHPFAHDDELSKSYKRHRTFTHGDPKQANLFFRKRPDGPDDLEVGLIDFQWTGFGLAATDVAHFVTSAVHADRLVDGGEDDLLRYYFGELQRHLVEYGAYGSVEDAIEGYGYDTFMEQYDTGFLDICRLVIAYTWARFGEAVEKEDEEGCARTMNKTSYNKSIPNVVWLMSRCDEIMKSRGV